MKIDPASLGFLRDLACATVEASRVAPRRHVGNSAANTTGGTIVRPGGCDDYPAFWVRDFAMSLPAGFITDEEVRHHLALTAGTQNGATERVLRGGAAVIPPFAVADHVNFDGRPVFYPGTYSPGDDQGGEPYGVCPPLCDHYYFVDIAHHLWRSTKSADFLREGQPIPLIERLYKAFAVPPVSAETGAVVTTPARRAVGFGFYDTVYLTGSLLFPTLLRYRAAGQLAALAGALDDENRAAECYSAEALIAKHVAKVFADPAHVGGWLIASTETGRQPDVWGTIYALHLGGVLPDDVAAVARDAVADAVRKGTITYQGGVRHIPTDHDHSPESAWQQTAGVPRGVYQNGAYWHTSTGWLISAIHRSHPEVAAAVMSDYLRALEEDDFRLGPEHGAPWECFGQHNANRQNPVYMASVTVPYAVLRDLREEEK
jgi:hypothetical protein